MGGYFFVYREYIKRRTTSGLWFVFLFGMCQLSNINEWKNHRSNAGRHCDIGYGGT